MSDYIVYIVSLSVFLFLAVVNIAMLVRAILSWFMQGETSRFTVFLYVITEPLILPVRRLIDRMGWFQGSPIDFSFLITNLLLVMMMEMAMAFL